jgi:hypothetical protein
MANVIVRYRGILVTHHTRHAPDRCDRRVLSAPILLSLPRYCRRNRLGSVTMFTALQISRSRSSRRLSAAR